MSDNERISQQLSLFGNLPEQTNPSNIKLLFLIVDNTNKVADKYQNEFNFISDKKIIRPVMGEAIFYLDYTARHFFADVKELRPLIRRIASRNIVFIGELVSRSKGDIQRITKVDPKLVDLLERELNSIGLGFSMDVRGWSFRAEERGR